MLHLTERARIISPRTCVEARHATLALQVLQIRSDAPDKKTVLQRVTAQESWRIPHARAFNRVWALLNLAQTAPPQIETQRSTAHEITLLARTATTFATCRRRHQRRRKSQSLKRIHVCGGHTVTQHTPSWLFSPARLLLPTWRGARGLGGRPFVVEENPPPPTGEMVQTARHKLGDRSCWLAWHQNACNVMVQVSLRLCECRRSGRTFSILALS